MNKGTGIASVTGGGSHTYGSNVSLGYTLSTGYNFSGWSGYTASSSFTMPAQSVTMQANASVINYSITYNLNGGSASNPSSYNVNTNTFTLNNPTRSGYTFTGWSGSGSGTSVSITKGSTGDKSYTANWKKLPTLKVESSASEYGARYITRIRVYNSSTDYTDYNNPSVGTKWTPTITVTPGQKVVFYHNNGSAYWSYHITSNSIQDLGYGVAAYFTVPSTASGDATLGFNSSSGSARFKHTATTTTTGWVKDEACYPTLGE